MKRYAFHGIFIMATAILLSAGCVSTKFLPAEGARSYPPTKQILILRSSPPEDTFEVLGIVAAEGTIEGKLLENLKKKAMSIGADGLILRRPIEISGEYASERQRKFSSYKIRYEGLAIRFKNQRDNGYK